MAYDAETMDGEIVRIVSKVEVETGSAGMGTILTAEDGRKFVVDASESLKLRELAAEAVETVAEEITEAVQNAAEAITEKVEETAGVITEALTDEGETPEA